MKVEHHITVHNWLRKGRTQDDVEKKAVDKRYVKDVMELDDRVLSYIEVWRLADFLNMPKLANYIMRCLIIQFDPQKFLYEDGYNFLPLAAPYYSKESDIRNPLRKWIFYLYASGLVKMPKSGLDCEDPKALVEGCSELLFDFQWLSHHWEGGRRRSS